MKTEQQLLLEMIVESLAKLDTKIDNKITESAKEINDNLADINTKINAQNISLARNTESLEAHMKRTELLELQVIPMKFWYDGFKFSAKVIAGLGVVVGIVLGIVEILSFLTRHSG